MTADGVFRIAAFSGYSGDRADALRDQAANSGSDVLFGDYLAEMNLATRALEMRNFPDLGYERPFLHHLKLAAPVIAEKRPKIITNAGALNPRGLAEAVVALLADEGIEDVQVAYVEGDDLMPRLDELAAAGETFPHLEDARPLSSWRLKPASANAYVGARGIVAALKAGADIVISGRCTDASPVIAGAAWFHGWEWDQYDQLAGALLAGHCIECGAYVTGGNSSGFRALKDQYFNFSMGIAEINKDGTFVVTKQPGMNGVVTDVTVRSQILYEIQGNVYLNPDVQALIDDIQVTDLGRDRVRVDGVRGVAPPETTKVGICGVAGYQAECWVAATGLDVQDKFDVLRRQVRENLGDKMNEFDVFDMTQYGVPMENARTEAQGTAMLRVMAQAKDIKAFGPARHLLPLVNPDGLGHFPGFQWQMDSRTCVPVPFMEYWPARVHVKHLPLTVRFVGSLMKIPVGPVSPAETQPVVKQSDYDPPAFDAVKWGPTTPGPLGWVVHARSGDKGGNANVGFFVRHKSEYEWLRTLLSRKKMVELLGDEFKGNRVERVEFPGMMAVHFVVHDYLGRGVSSTVRMDSLAKSVAEFLRARHVDLPNRFLLKSKI
ncbi:hypothetical protein CspeluHIS016_0101480 [Cutaneotrichosporon spelunceum]|uniref:DUF1446-domain-containing protein n=1 Tax=Cutaneotrichosporon spelunceum TaxID=1672016 RepID=A0AAD3TNA5_9TREE|nr:hypothetical protein CspeluHIS016_0101480 [Cutaneotrichosporon spelunceum]